MNEIIIRIRNWEEQRDYRRSTGTPEQFEVLIDGEKIPRLEKFSIDLTNYMDRTYDPDVRKDFSYTIKQYIDCDSWKPPS